MTHENKNKGQRIKNPFLLPFEDVYIELKNRKEGNKLIDCVMTAPEISTNLNYIFPYQTAYDLKKDFYFIPFSVLMYYACLVNP